MKKNILIFLYFLGITFLFSGGFLNTYFQQDEWNGFGTVMYLSHQPFYRWLGVLGSYHFAPISNYFYYLLYIFFGYQAKYFALTSLVLHSIASFLVFLLIRKITKTNSLGFIGALIFAVNFNTSQAYLHLGVFPATITCFIAVILFMFYTISLPEKHIFSLKDGLVLSILFLLSVGLREDGLLLIPLFFLWLILFRRKNTILKNKKFFFSFGSIIVLFFLFRLLLQVFTPHDISVINGNYWQTFFINLIWFAPKIFAQTMVSANDLVIFIWNNVGRVIGVSITLTSVFEIFFPATVICIDIVLWVFFGLGILFGKKNDRRMILFGIGWTVAYSILLSAVGRQMDVVETRYLYFPSFGIILSLIVAANSILRSIPKKNIHVKSVIGFTFGFIFLMFFLFSYKSIHQTVQADITQANARKSIISNLKKLYPLLPKKAIFFVQCRDLCYRNTEFGLPNSAVLPFSSGPGYVFLLQYAKENEQAYSNFFRKQQNGIEFLWDFNSEGYKEINGYGFGYFIHKNTLEAALKKYNLSPNVVIGLEYNEMTFTFSDVSQKVRAEIVEDNEKNK